MITRVVLAAGRSSRMGETKALMDLGGETALSRILGLVAGDSTRLPTVVVCGHDSERVAEEAERHGAIPVLNPDWHLGQTSSLKAGLRALPRETSAAWLHPVDLPLVNQSDYLSCWDGWQEKGGPDELLVSSINHRRGHPLVFGINWFEAFLNLADDEPARAVTRSAGERVHHIIVSNPWVRDDLDTPEDLERARQFLSS